MGLVKKFISSFARTPNYYGKKADFIFYKIVDLDQNNLEYMLQCINTNAIFRSSLTNIVFDLDILHGLHPTQACYTGIEYALYLKNPVTSTIQKNEQKKHLNNYSVCRYGNYMLCHQDRKGKLFFINRVNHEEFLMDPREIALSEQLINEFDAAQAFYIGLLSGLKLYSLRKNNHNEDFHHSSKYPHLRLIKK